MKILIACEFSGIVREAFLSRGHDAWSCDLLPSEKPGPHIQGNVLSVVGDGWDMLIAFPPCTHLAVSGARWFAAKRNEQAAALEFVRTLLNAPIPLIALENPVSIISTHIRKPDQIIQPWQFGHGETKTTCLWLKGLPKLQPTRIVEGRAQRVHHEPPSPDRWKNRSRTLPGISEAMARQWGVREHQESPLPSPIKIPLHTKAGGIYHPFQSKPTNTNCQSRQFQPCQRLWHLNGQRNLAAPILMGNPGGE